MPKAAEIVKFKNGTVHIYVEVVRFFIGGINADSNEPSCSTTRTGKLAVNKCIFIFSTALRGLDNE